MASFIVYYGLFKLRPVPVVRARRAYAPVQDEAAANGRMPARV